MTSNITAPDGARPRAWAGLLAAVVAVLALVYGSELANFSLSIDEEAATFLPAGEIAWLSQGRWGMALLVLLLPNFEAIPLLSTVLFCAGLAFASVRGALDFGLRGQRAYFFAVVHAGFPLWLHIAEFNTFAAGFGFGLAAAAFGAGLAARADSMRDRALATATLMFAISVYQTLSLYAALYALFALHAQCEARLRTDSARAALRALAARASAVAASFLAALAGYWLIQRAAMGLAGVETAYVDAYLQTARLSADPRGTVAAGLHGLADYLGGRDAMYLGLGIGVLFPVWAGLLPWSALDRSSAARRGAGLPLFWATLAIALAALAVPFVLSAGLLPIRAHIAWPLLAAWLASRCALPEGPRWRGAAALALAYYAIVVGSIGASLFYTERLVRAADAALTRDLVPVMLEAAGPRAGARVPFALSGQFVFPAEGQIQRAGVFGTSFYEHDGGNVRRVVLYMKTLGIHRFEPVWLGSRPDLLPAAHAMPAWPATGSVRRVNGVVIVKLGPPTPPQLVPPG